MVTLSLRSETMNAKGKMNPCHSPSQKPATEPSAPGEFLKTFGPAVQPAERHRANKRKRPKTATSGFFTIPPRERSGMNRQILTQRCCGCVGQKIILERRDRPHSDRGESKPACLKRGTSMRHPHAPELPALPSLDSRILRCCRQHYILLTLLT